MTDPGLQHLGMHANRLANGCGDSKMQAILQWVGVGSVIMMGLAATVHLIKDVMKPSHEPAPYPRRHYEERFEKREYDKDR